MYYYSNTLTKAKEETLLYFDKRGSKPRAQVTSSEDNEEAEEDGTYGKGYSDKVRFLLFI